MNAQLSLLSECPCGRSGCRLPEPLFDAGDVMERWVQAQGVTMGELKGRSLQPEIVEMRLRVAVYLRDHGWSWPRIGRFLDRDHSAVMHLVKTRQRRVSVVA